MALKSSDPKENDKILKKKIISSFWGVSGSLKTPKNPKKGGFRGAGNPPKLGEFFFQNFIIFFGL